MSELLLKGWLLNSLQEVWCDSINPGAGATFGFPDIGLLVPNTPIYMPVELKLAEIKHTPEKHWDILDVREPSGRAQGVTPARDDIRPVRLRPNQIAWHDGFTRAGGYSRLAMGLKTDAGWRLWIMDRPQQHQLKDWKKGFPEHRFLKVAEAGQLDLDLWWHGPLVWWHDRAAALRQPRQPPAELAGAEIEALS